ncbi:hypothetical protein G6F46_015374 [Rhizopus delemar]|nr:hypothetical protein G6F46_015374 [Rhizopus delemar]
MRLAVDHHGGRLRAQAQAIHGFQREIPVRGAGVEIAAQLGARMGSKVFAAHGLTGFGAADFKRMARGRFAAEVRVEGDDAVDFGARQVQGRRAGFHRHGPDTAHLMGGHQ